MRFTSAFFLIVFLTACASSGTEFEIADANRITNGMTRQEVTQLMGGPPNMVVGQGATLIWSYAHVGFLGGTESRTVRLNFDKDGKTFGIPDNGIFGDSGKYLEEADDED